MVSHVPRFPWPESGLTGEGVVRLGPAAEHHLLRVLRRRVGDPLILFDEEHEFGARIVGLDPLRVVIEERRRVRRESPLDLVLHPALLRPARMSWLVEKAVELGVSELVAFGADRGDGRRLRQPDKVVDRWQRIVAAAMQQSGRTRPMKVSLVAALDQLPLPTGTWVYLHPGGSGPPPDLGALEQPLHVVVGPEGGLSPREVGLLERERAHPLTLGPRILRAETAAITAAAVLEYLLGDLSPCRTHDRCPPADEMTP